MSNALTRLNEEGVSIWLDDLSRDRIDSGNLRNLDPVFRASDGVDGRVSIEVAPDLAYDTDATVASARRIWDAVDRRNCYIKIPATVQGYAAIRRCLGEGIDVNVTLIFGLEQYDAVLEAFIDGLEDARDAGLDIATMGDTAEDGSASSAPAVGVHWRERSLPPRHQVRRGAGRARHGDDPA